MDFKKFMGDLHRIEIAPNTNWVRVARESNGNTVLWFNILEPRYFPEGIRRIFIARAGGAGAVYVYTTNDKYPHLTLTTDQPGGNPHWTTAFRTYDNDGAPECIKELLGLYPDPPSEFH